MIQKEFVDKIVTYFTFNNFFYRKSCHLCYSVETYGRPTQATDDNITRHMRSARCINKAADTQSEYIIILAFTRQQWLRERASMLRHTYCTLRVLLFATRVAENKLSENAAPRNYAVSNSSTSAVICW